MNIDIGPVYDLHAETIVEAPYPDIYIGPRRRPDPGPPTTRALTRALASLAEESQNQKQQQDR